MIFNKNIIYAKVWKITPSEKYVDLRITTSEKKDDGTYVNSTWFPRVIGHAMNSLKGLKEGDRICITKCKFTNEAYKKQGSDEVRSLFKFLILEATIEGANSGNVNDDAGGDTDTEETSTDEHNKTEEDCPW